MQPTRRQALLAGVAVSAAVTQACTPDRTPARRRPTPDDQLRAEAVVREQALVDAYLAAMHAHPALTRRLAPVLGDHAAHLAALDATPPASTAPPSAPTSPTSPSSPTAPTAPTEPTRPATTAKAALAALVARERAAAAAHAQAAVAAESALTCGRTLSPLLASLAACEASHAAVLA